MLSEKWSVWEEASRTGEKTARFQEVVEKKRGERDEERRRVRLY